MILQHASVLIPWKLSLYNKLVSSFAHIFLWRKSGLDGPRSVTSFSSGLGSPCLPFRFDVLMILSLLSDLCSGSWAVITFVSAL